VDNGSHPVTNGSDPWPFVAAEIPHAWVEVRNVFTEPQPGFMALAEARFRAGEKEYKGTSGEWLRKPTSKVSRSRPRRLCNNRMPLSQG
jgi:hypothetical protein